MSLSQVNLSIQESNSQTFKRLALSSINTKTSVLSLEQHDVVSFQGEHGVHNALVHILNLIHQF
jgi:hypothetical protein